MQMFLVRAFRRSSNEISVTTERDH